MNESNESKPISHIILSSSASIYQKEFEITRNKRKITLDQIKDISKFSQPEMKEEVLLLPAIARQEIYPRHNFSPPMLALGSALLLFSFFFFSLPLGPFSTSDKRLADGRTTRENDATYPHAIYQPPPHKGTPEPGALFGITMLIVRSMPRKMPGK